MKKVILLLLSSLLLAGCRSETEPVPETVPATETEVPAVTETQTATESPVLEFTTPYYENVLLGNPWEDYTSLEEAEDACGLDFPLEEVVAGSYRAESCRVMNRELLEVTYRDDSFEVTVRMQAGEGQDLSGVYEEFENITTYEMETHTIINKKIKDGGILQLISMDGYSYSFYAPNHYWGDSNADFLAFLNQ